MNKLRALLRTIDTISDKTGKFFSHFFLLMIVSLIFEIVARYVFNRPTFWAHETSLFIFGTIGIMGGAYALRHGAHVKVDVIYGRMSPRLQATFDTVTATLFFIFIGILVWRGTGMAVQSWLTLEHTPSVWGPPLYPLRTFVPIGAFFLLLQGLAKFTRDLIFAISGRQM
ncbi:TRAP transporter small permease subunit [Chloroflexota bacterium]